MPRLSKTKVGLIITALALCVHLLDIPLIRHIDNRLLDLKFHLRGPLSPAMPIVLIAINQESLQEVGKWPWPRDRIAELVRKIAEHKPRLIGIDLLFSEPSYRPEEDIALADAIRDAGNVILSTLFYILPGEGRFQSQKEYESNLSRLQSSRINLIRSLGGSEQKLKLLTAYGVLANIEPFSNAALSQAFYNVIPSNDGYIRQCPILIQAAEDVYHSFAVSMQSAWHGATSEELVVDRGYVFAFLLHGPGNALWKVPADRFGNLLINYYGVDRFPTHGASDILAGRIDKTALRDKIVILGGTSIADFSMAATPFDPTTSSIEIQATVLDNVLGERALVSGYISRLICILSIIVPGLLISLFLPRFQRISSGAFFTCSALFGYALLDLYLFSQYRLVLESIYPLTTIVSIYFGINIYSYALLTGEIRCLEQALWGVDATVIDRLNIERFMPSILQFIVKHLNAERGLFIVSRERPLESLEGMGQENFRAFHGLDYHTLMSDHCAYERNIINQTLKSRQPRLVGKAWKDKRYQYLGVGYELGSILCLPVTARGRVTGILYIDAVRGGYRLSRNEMRIMLLLIPALRVAIENAWLHSELKMEEEKLRTEVVYLKREIEKEERFRDIVGKSPRIRAIFNLIEKAAASSISVLIEGETGTGKELAARAIHNLSERKDNLFVAQSCAALPEHLLESELFGHKKGAFTGATADKNGLFEIADGGTMFLDEIGDSPPAVQVMLLRVLQDGVIRPLGSLDEKKVDVRIISATNKDLEEEVKKGNFREDLYYRLNAFQLKMPPLRERREDIPLLVAHFLDKYRAEMKKEIKGVSPGAMAALCAYDYPGNIRELENEIRRVVSMTPHGLIVESSALSDKIKRPAETVITPLESRGEAVTLKDAVEIVERHLVNQVMIKHNNNKTLAAKELGISRNTLHSMLKRLNMEK